MLKESGLPSFSCHPRREAPRYWTADSLLESARAIRRRAGGDAPRVLLMVPAYTRLVEPAPAGSRFQEIGIDHFEVMKRAGTPIGLLRIGTAAKLAGYEVKIIDSPFMAWHQEWKVLDLPNQAKLLRYGLNDDQLRALIADFDPDIVGIQCNYTVQWGNARALADLVKAMDRSIPVVAGGAHCSGDWANVVMDSAIDCVVINEADRSFVELLHAMTQKEVPAEGVLGIGYRRAAEPVNSNVELRGRIKSQYLSILPKSQSLAERKQALPLPDFGFLDMRQYDLPFHSAGKRVRDSGAWVQIFSTIGCNVNCSFCYIPKVNGPWRALGADWFDEHLADMKRHGVTEILLEDDHLMHDPLYALEIFDLLEKHDLPWVEEGGLSLFNLILLHLGQPFIDSMSDSEQRDPNYRFVIEAVKQGITARYLIRRMAESGCYNVYLAVESANVESLENSHKPKLNAMNLAAVEIVSLFAEVGIQVTGGFMLGFVNPPPQPGGEPYIETLEQIDNTIRYARELMDNGMAYANPFIVTPIPGTPLTEYQKRYVVRDYDTGWSHEKATMATDKWSADDIERMRLKLLVDANGKDRVLEMVNRGTWPVDAPESRLLA